MIQDILAVSLVHGSTFLIVLNLSIFIMCSFPPDVPYTTADFTPEVHSLPSRGLSRHIKAVCAPHYIPEPRPNLEQSKAHAEANLPWEVRVFIHSPLPSALRHTPFQVSLQMDVDPNNCSSVSLIRKPKKYPPRTLTGSLLSRRGEYAWFYIRTGRLQLEHHTQ